MVINTATKIAFTEKLRRLHHNGISRLIWQHRKQVAEKHLKIDIRYIIPYFYFFEFNFLTESSFTHFLFKPALFADDFDFPMPGQSQRPLVMHFHTDRTY